jgi:hypothetical protein
MVELSSKLRACLQLWLASEIGSTETAVSRFKCGRPAGGTSRKHSSTRAVWRRTLIMLFAGFPPVVVPAAGMSATRPVLKFLQVAQQCTAGSQSGRNISKSTWSRAQISQHAKPDKGLSSGRVLFVALYNQAAAAGPAPGSTVLRRCRCGRGLVAFGARGPVDRCMSVVCGRGRRRGGRK